MLTLFSATFPILLFLIVIYRYFFVDKFTSV